jgi:hypothetical protein
MKSRIVISVLTAELQKLVASANIVRKITSKRMKCVECGEEGVEGSRRYICNSVRKTSRLQVV